MSKIRSHKTARFARAAYIVLAALVLFPATSPCGERSGKMKATGTRELIGTVTAKYAIFQADQEIGSESVTRYDYDDNSVVFESKTEMHYTHGAEMYVETTLTSEEESRFPMRYHMTKKMSQGGHDIEDIIDIEWFANVAVVVRTVQGATDTTRLTVPTGTAVFDPVVAYQLYTPLFWYNRDAGGTQSFNTLDPALRAVHTAILKDQTQEEIEIGGETLDVTRYEFDRDRIQFKVYVDVEGRIVKVDQGYLIYVLSEWSESGPHDE